MIIIPAPERFERGGWTPPWRLAKAVFGPLLGWETGDSPFRALMPRVGGRTPPGGLEEAAFRLVAAGHEAAGPPPFGLGEAAFRLFDWLFRAFRSWAGWM